MGDLWTRANMSGTRCLFVAPGGNSGRRESGGEREIDGNNSGRRQRGREGQRTRGDDGYWVTRQFFLSARRATFKAPHPLKHPVLTLYRQPGQKHNVIKKLVWCSLPNRGQTARCQPRKAGFDALNISAFLYSTHFLYIYIPDMAVILLPFRCPCDGKTGSRQLDGITEAPL